MKFKDNKEILLVSHAVLGYPSFELCLESVAEMARVGVDIIELQIPFSDPQADGPFFTAAQQESVEKGTTTEQCFEFAEEVCRDYPEVNFVFMTYYNIVYKYGVNEFVERAAKIGVKGFILPDLPVEESEEYIAACREHNVDPILMFTPTTSDERMRKIAAQASGFIYCQARLGVTGTHTKFGPEEEAYIARARAATDLPLAMGFGIQQKEDVDFLKGKVDIAICCTQAIKALVNGGVSEMGEFLEGLR
ncbi:tryptophan synthase subunit alpha [Candidatus Peregrinibacteria bacterium]|jgi:tryptophan synthase alpha chain|nr:tryptophan synthase subunit alpha [Candidatus Peregrinibacteria bacterium]MBT7483719.1 tryptophan synthase subunit alpha [Candidatus Peregrinibacteria bacterium]MBT7703260.1 tryptophan synthase subunit alpha [Candidatus Peregrinibacteria bacterium]